MMVCGARPRSAYRARRRCAGCSQEHVHGVCDGLAAQRAQKHAWLTNWCGLDTDALMMTVEGRTTPTDMVRVGLSRGASAGCSSRSSAQASSAS
jgi:hypothetical protein